MKQRHMEPGRCQKAVPFDGRMVGFHQCLRKAVVDGQWCRQHDPARRQAKAAVQAKQDAAYQSEQARTLKRAKALAKALGAGEPFYNIPWRGRGGYTEHLLLTFAEVEHLLDCLYEVGQSLMLTSWHSRRTTSPWGPASTSRSKTLPCSASAAISPRTSRPSGSGSRRPRRR